MQLTQAKMSSPLGQLTLVANDKALQAVLWQHDEQHVLMRQSQVQVGDHPVLAAAFTQLQDYFSGNRYEFELDLSMQGSDFQIQVWRALQSIPYGETVSYLDIAKHIKRPEAVRAVGGAIGRNPLSIIVPCHRVIGTNGKLTGFGGGLDAKTFLLQLEQVQQQAVA